MNSYQFSLHFCEMLKICLLLLSTLNVVLCRECYNFREEPRVRQCEYGCCGDDYQETCCNATLQIIGSAIGAIVLISIIAGIAYYCYRQKSKRHQMRAGGMRTTARPGILGRLGMRSPNVTNVAQHQPNQRTSHRVHVPHNVPISTGHGQHGHYNPGYMAPNMPPPPDYLYPANHGQAGATLAPTAPMPPPYSMTMAPPPYSSSKGPPPPPEYSSVVSTVGPHYKYDHFQVGNNMPRPSD